MAHFRNSSRGPRGILLAGGGFKFIDPGQIGYVRDDKIRTVPHGLDEVDPADLPEVEDEEAEALEPAPDDLGLEGEGGQIEPVPYPGNLVLVSVGENGEHTVHAPWLVQPEVYADPELAEARQAELRELGPPEDWVDPEPPEVEAKEGTFDHDESGENGGSKAPAPSDELTAKRRDYKAALGKNAFPGWDMAELDKRIAAHAAETKA